MDDAVLLNTSLFKVAGNPPASPLLLRTADIHNGRLVPVDLSGDRNQPMLKPSEDLSYEKNTMGVWSWSPAAPAPMGARTCERPDIRPVRIAEVQASSDEEVLDAALAGIQAPAAVFRTLFAYPVPGGLRGFLCEAEDVESDEGLLRLKDLPIVALFHDVREEDIITLHKNLPPGASELTFVANARGFSRPGEPYPTRYGEERVAGLVYGLITSPAFQRRAALLGNEGAGEIYEELLGSALDERTAAELGLSEAAAAVVTAAFRERTERALALQGAAGEAVAGLLLMHQTVRERCERIVRGERGESTEPAADAAVPEHAENERSSAEAELARIQEEIQAAEVRRDELLAETAALENAAVQRKEIEEGLTAEEAVPAAVLTDKIHLGEDLAAAEARKAALQEEISDLEELRATALSDLYEEVERCREVELDLEKGLHELIGHEAVAADILPAAGEDQIVRGNGWEYLRPGFIEKSSESAGWQDEYRALKANLETPARSGAPFVPEGASAVLAAYLYAAYLSGVPLILAGPDGNELADALAASITGREAGRLILTGPNDPKLRHESREFTSGVVAVSNILHDRWIDSLPEALSRSDLYPVWTHPYSEDLRKLPAGLYNYVLPVLTDLFVQEKPAGSFDAAGRSETFVPFSEEERVTTSLPSMLSLGTSPYFTSRLQRVLGTAAGILGDAANPTDLEMLFGVLPVCMVRGDAALAWKILDENIDVSRMVRVMAGSCLPAELKAES